MTKAKSQSTHTAPKVFLSRRVTFSASHRLHSDALSAQENKRIFGKCNYDNGHGHNYVLEVILFGSVDPKSGVVMNLTDLKQIIEQEIMTRMDHRHLNLDVHELKGINPTTENVAVVIWDILQKKIPNNLLYEVRLHETENNIVSYRGER